MEKDKGLTKTPINVMDPGAGNSTVNAINKSPLMKLLPRSGIPLPLRALASPGEMTCHTRIGLFIYTSGSARNSNMKDKWATPNPSCTYISGSRLYADFLATEVFKNKIHTG